MWLPRDLVPRPVIETDGRAIVLDLGTDSREFDTPLAGMPVVTFSRLIDEKMARAGTGFAFGRWGERRDLYTGEHYASPDAGARRNVHLGVDLFCRAETPVFAPLAGRVHRIANIARDLDYGPLLILEHAPPGSTPFFTLYGHLSLASTAAIVEGQAVRAGEPIARIGSPPENGNWPPHLHFQVILDLLGLDVDFPGVAAANDQDHWLALSPLPAPFFPELDARLLDGRARGP